MRVYSNAFCAPKSGSTAAEYEDAYWLRGEGEHVRRSHRYAIADGATESSLAGDWARLLVHTFGQSSHLRLSGAVMRARATWPRHLQDYVALREQKGAPLQWYEEPKLQRGAFATLLTLDLLDRPAADALATERTRTEISVGPWHAAAVGDSCLFQVRGDVLVNAFPITDSASFGCAPPLIPTSALRASVLRKNIRTAVGTWLLDDSFYLGTDAISSWFLQAYESGGKPWEQLRDLGTQDADDFASFVRELRSQGRLRNDDVTLIRVDIF
jgi:hypothetical protein